ncbi:hypothetical protein ACOI22_06160 [Glaciecola sp. 2405UD65-10]|uniref:hypothetical protein n=1 Tax=Glaciecola sp. 2405UD65-10 TaxID=3397244 RepID=UPI003B5C0098
MSQNQDMHQNTEAKSSLSNRRKFLVKASAGTLVASIPAKPLWATEFTNSIQASGGPSGFGGNAVVVTKSSAQWVALAEGLDSHVLHLTFDSIFGGAPWKRADKSRVYSGSLTVLEVLTTKKTNGNYKYHGPSSINLNMLSLWLNAKYHNDSRYGINYPVVGPTAHFKDLHSFGQRVYQISVDNALSTYSAQLTSMM